MVFRRLFTIWFVLFTLTSSVAWAMGDHMEEDHGVTALKISSIHDEPLPWSQDACSDHCCHASAHSIGLIASMVGVAVPPLVDNELVSESLPISLTLSPPFRPPIA